MKAKKFNLFLCVLFSLTMKAQVVYFDPFVTGMLSANSVTLRNGQKRISDEQSKLQRAQGWVSAQMVQINNVQNKIYKGLSEVSGTLSNGLQVKSILAELQKCGEYSKNVAELAKQKPQYAIFGKKATEKAYSYRCKSTTRKFFHRYVEF